MKKALTSRKITWLLLLIPMGILAFVRVGTNAKSSLTSDYRKDALRELAYQLWLHPLANKHVLQWKTQAHTPTVIYERNRQTLTFDMQGTLWNSSQFTGVSRFDILKAAYNRETLDGLEKTHPRIYQYDWQGSIVDPQAVWPNPY